ncbi:hypothetical protein ACHAWF_012008 [Thalassiosira exigua]
MHRLSLHRCPFILALVASPPAARSFLPIPGGLGRGREAAATALRAATAEASWKPCPQPRFDEFASCTVGPWIAASTKEGGDDDSPPATTREAHEVEEVMRSCGGAVQGVRELPLSLVFPADEGDVAEGRTYHNRADGGFVYADDGSYSSGPERWDWAKEEVTAVANARELAMASLAFPGRRRMWLTAELSEASKLLADSDGKEDGAMCLMDATAMELHRPPSATSQFSDIAGSMPSRAIPKVQWQIIQRVRMPNPTQPWSLARAKWEKLLLEPDTESEQLDSAATGPEEIGPLAAWTFVESTSGGKKRPIFGDATASDAINLHMLAVCTTSRVARSAVRCYDADGLLKSVAFLHGSLAKESDREWRCDQATIS